MDTPWGQACTHQAHTHTHSCDWYLLHVSKYTYMCIKLIFPTFSESQLDFIVERDLTLTFDTTSRRQCFDVRIIADQNDNEPEEFFSLVLSLIQFFPGLSIDPERDTALVTILPSLRKSILDSRLPKLDVLVVL